MIYSIDDLHKESRELNYPENMHPIPEMNEFFRFFPGGYGTLDKSKGVIKKKYMFLGQDWGTNEQFYNPNAAPDRENKNITVTNVDNFIKSLNINQEDCFFTNAIMGMRVGGSSTGKSPAKKHIDFMDKCHDFLKTQIKTINPDVVFVMGKETAYFVAKAYNIKDWMKIKDIRELFTSDNFSKVPGDEKIKFIYMTHPAFRPTNIAKRWGKDNDRELELTHQKINDITIRE